MANRTVSVLLELKADQYKAEADLVKQKTEAIDRATKDLDRDVKQLTPDAVAASAAMATMGDGASKAKTETAGLGEETQKTRQNIVDLAKDIESTKASLAAMGEEFQRTGKVNVDELSKLTRTLRELERAKKELDKLVPVGGGNTSGSGGGGGLLNFALDEWAANLAKKTDQGLQQGLDALSGTAPTGFVQWLIAGAVAAAPAIGAAVNAAILLGVGAGGLAAGIAGAFQDPQVKATWSDFGDFLKSGLADASSSFVQPMEDAAVTLRAALSKFFTGLNLDVLAPSLTRVADGLGGLVNNMLPGLNSALQASAPLLNAVADEMPQIGSSMSFFFDQIAQGGPGAVQFFKDLATVTEGTVGTLGVLTSTLSKAYEQVRTADPLGKAAALGPLGSLLDLVEANKQKKKSDDDAAQAVANHRVQLTDQAFAAQQAKMSIDQLSSAINKEVSANLAAKNTHLQFNQSLLDLNTSVKQNGKVLNDSSQAGIANEQAILKAAAAAEADRQSVQQQTGDVQKATQVFDDHMQKVYALAAALHLNKDQVDALIGSVKSIPHENPIDIQLRGADVAEDDIRTYKNYLASIPPSKTTYINTIHQQLFADPTGHFTPNGAGGPPPSRWGNVFEHAAVGALREADTFSAVSSGARYAYAEPSTGGEAFIPRYGDLERSRSIWSYVGQNWLGMRPGGGGSAYAPTYHVTVQAGVGNPQEIGAVVVKAIKGYEQANGKGWRS